MKDIYAIIRNVRLSEKATYLQEMNNEVVLEVDRRANKLEIKQAVEHFFGVSVTQVRTMNYRGKVKRMGRFEGKRADWKKAVVTLAEGDTIDLFEIV
jgi:large subunit ribosomal protein L23